jgi:hypothetical protein
VLSVSIKGPNSRDKKSCGWGRKIDSGFVREPLMESL